VWYASKISAAPIAEPVTLDQAKQQCRVDGSDDDAVLERLIKAARSHVEKYCNARWAEQTIVCECGAFSDFARLPEGPLKSVTSVVYIDPAGETQTLDVGVYEAHKDGLEPSIALKPGQSWPAIQAGTRVVLTAIFGGAVPECVQHAMLVFVDNAYHQRENAKYDDWTVLDVLLCNDRRGV
jgi:uncharacterized phiE125 gp8 family phage protein